jgi:Sec-independent protein translocase protein TatA
VGDFVIVLLVVLVLVLLWRGPKTLPRLGEALGRGVREARTQASQPPDPAEPAASPPPAPPPDGDRRP